MALNIVHRKGSNYALRATRRLCKPFYQLKHSLRYASSIREPLDKKTQGIKFSTLHELQESALKVYATKELFGTYDPALEDFHFLKYDEFGRRINRCRQVLREIGIGEHDKVAMISNNRWEWATIACAAYSLNATIVPMYEAQLPSDWTYILNDSGSSAVFCATQDIFNRVRRDVLPSTPSVQASLCLDGPVDQDYSFTLAMSRATDDGTSTVIPPAPEDLADLIYTSGTTGQPKGVELTHNNFVSNIKSAMAMVDNPRDLVSENDRTLAFLPWAHSYGQTCELWMCLASGASMGIFRGIPKILEDLQLVKPTILFSVPTLYKKVYDGVQNMIETQSPLRAQLLRTALKLGSENADAKNGTRGPLGPLERMKLSILDKIVLSKIRDKFGGNMRYGCVAGSACPPDVLRFMDSLGIPICEGYGLTETSPIITLNVPTQRLVGSVGKAVGGVTVHIIGDDGQPVAPGEEGEICCVGPNVMNGYHNNQEATDDVITLAPDGKSRMFHTGDLGRLDSDGWLRVTGRIKEQYKLENGKYVVPTPVETAIGMSRFISQVVLYGSNRPHNVALIVPEWNAIRMELDMGDGVTEEELANDERVARLIDGEIASHCAKLKKFEVPTKWAFVAPFTAANNMITPKMSIRRHKVVEAYEDVLSHLYGDEPVKVNKEKHHQEAA